MEEGKTRKVLNKRHCIIAVCMILLFGISIVYLSQRKRVPYVKEDTFVFAYGEEIPTTSAYYLAYQDTYEDIEFDEETFALKDIGEYTVDVLFHDLPLTIHIKIEDQDFPVITFQEGDIIEVLRLHDEVVADQLFSVTDASDVQINVEPSLRDLKSGTQEICVTASDAYEHTQKECATLTIEVLDYAISSQNTYESAEEIIASFIKTYHLNPNTFGFFYYDVNDQESYVYSGDTTFNAASTIKIPLNMLYYDLQTKGEVSSSTSYKLLAKDVEEGDGNTIIDHKIGASIPLSYLQKESIVNSDNTATNMLIRGLGGFSKFRSLLPSFSDAKLPSTFETSNVITPNYMLDVMTLLYTQQSQYEALITNMKQATAGKYLQASTDAFAIAQKYGLFDNSLHTVGIVYTPQPFIIGIYTNNVPQAEAFITKLNTAFIDYQLQK